MKTCQPRALTPFLDRELSDDMWQEVSDHLQGCPKCGTLLDELSLASQQVRSMGRAEIPKSALQSALEIVGERAGLPREPGMSQAASSMLGSETWASEPETPFSTTAMYEWSDPAETHRTEASATSAGAEPGTSLPEEDPAVSADGDETLPEHPNPPPKEIRPPWMAAATGDEDLEEAGRRAVDEAIEAAEEPAAASPLDGPTRMGSLFNRLHDQPAATTQTPEPETAGTEIAHAGVEPPPVETPPVSGPPQSRREGFWSRPPRLPARSAGGLGTPRDQLRIGLISALVLIVLTTMILSTGKGTHQVSTGPTRSSPTPHSTQSPATSPTPAASPSAVPSPPPSQAPTVQLTEVVTAGSGGGGWHVVRVRVGRPSAAITRVVFDLEGGGPAPDARLGRGPDSALYLTASGIAIPPSGLGFTGAGPITGVTQTDPSGLALRLATTGNPGFSMYYLSAPNRLVLDLK